MVTRASHIKTIAPPNLSVDFHLRLAQEYVNADHDPENVDVARSYETFRRQIMRQYNLLIRDGVDVQFTSGDPYASAAELFADLDHGRLAIFTGGDLPDSHLMAKRVSSAHAMPLNVYFRAVHDYFGHYGRMLTGSARYPFGTVAFIDGGDGLWNEERAYQRHKAMFSRDAWMALTCETRAQTACNNLLRPEGGFIDQKCVNLPAWAYSE